MSTKLKIDLSQGLLEVEGSESFVKSIYADFKTHFAGIEIPEELKPKARSRRSPAIKKTATASPSPSPPPSPLPPEPSKPAGPSTAAASAVAVPETPAMAKAPIVTSPYTYLTDLKLGATPDRPSLVDFMDSKLPITNEEHNIVFLYYMQHLAKLKAITIDHLYTAYRLAKIRAPLNIEKTFDQRGWIKVAKNGNMTLTAAGKKYVEQSMPKKLKG